MAVAAVAYDHLTPATKAKVAKLLARNKFPTGGEDDVLPADEAKAGFMMAATAADAIKGDRKDYIDDGEDPTNKTKAPDADANSGFGDRYMHKYWHYIDKPFSPDGTKLVEPPTVNVQERIGLFRKTLSSNASDQLKAYDLIWLLHLVGDIHQPLHATSRFTKDGNKTEGDVGGNSVKLCTTETSCRLALHAFWDDLLGTSSSVAAAIKVADQLPKADEVLASKSREAEWADESFTAAQKWVYATPIDATRGPFTLTAKYQANAKKEARERVALAGARLARLLNSELK
jgi:hypothetical protein